MFRHWSWGRGRNAASLSTSVSPRGSSRSRRPPVMVDDDRAHHGLSVSVLSSASLDTSSEQDVSRTRRALAVCDLWYGSNGFAGVKALRRTLWDVVVVPE